MSLAQLLVVNEVLEAVDNEDLDESLEKSVGDVYDPAGEFKETAEANGGRE